MSPLDRMRVGVPELSAVETDETHPSTADVVIVGAGIIGVSTAFFLAQKGLSVIVLEKGQVAAEQSGRNWGWCRVQNRHPCEIPLMLHSFELWDRMTEMTGEDVGFRRCATLHLAESQDGANRLRSWLELSAKYPVRVDLLNGVEIADKLPRAKPYEAGLFSVTEGRAEPQLVTPALARAARRLGVKIVSNCAAFDVITRNGKVEGVSGEGGRVACSRVLLAGGVWSSLLCRQLGLRLPQLRLHSTVCKVEPHPSIPDMSIIAPGFSIRPRINGGATLTIGLTAIAHIVPDSIRFFRDFLPVMRDRDAYGVRARIGQRFLKEMFGSVQRRLTRERIYDVSPYVPDIEAALANIGNSLGLGDLSVDQVWAGEFDVTPDALPVIDEAPGCHGLFVSTGYSGHGFGLGPGAGHATAELVSGGKPIVDLRPFRFDRFMQTTGTVTLVE
jgi:glycine/D-amino acid oxidase-like deaminating enzyme